MTMKATVTIALIALAAVFLFFAVNVIWLGTIEFFKIYWPKAKKLDESRNEDKNSLTETKHE